MLKPRSHSRRLLVIHRDPEVREALCRSSAGAGWDVRACAGVAEALESFPGREVDFVALYGDYGGGHRFQQSSAEALTALQSLRRISSTLQIVLLVTPGTTLSECVNAVACGVAGFLEIHEGRFDSEQLKSRLEVAFERGLRESASLHQFQAGSVFSETGFVGRSDAMARLLLKALRIARVSDAPVLITGESGTGKQRLAELLHQADPKRSRAPFISVNCSAIAGGIAESALFGHVRGAFTGANKDRAGYFRAADGGVLLLDEIGELEPTLQPKLLRVIQEGLVMPVGSDREQAVDVRVIAATHRRLPALVHEGKFRLDLYQRLSVIELEIPPLRERPEDIPPLVEYLVKKYSYYYGGTVEKVDPRVHEVLTQHALAGNVRQLENIIRRSLVMKLAGDSLELADLPEDVLRPVEVPGQGRNTALPREIIEQTCRQIDRGVLTLSDFLSECERSVLHTLLSEGHLSRTDLAKKLGVSRRTLYNMRNRLSLERPPENAT